VVFWVDMAQVESIEDLMILRMRVVSCSERLRVCVHAMANKFGKKAAHLHCSVTIYERNGCYESSVPPGTLKGSTTICDGCAVARTLTA